MKISRVLVVGSLNIDMVLKIDRMPETGENLFARDFSMLPGGKGNNQAIACARLGLMVYMIGKIGDDDFGARLRMNLEQENVDFSFVTRQSLTHSGLAFIFIDQYGENRIIVAPGANMKLGVGDLENASQLFETCEFLILQLEVPHDVVKKAIQHAHDYGVKVILNPAPAQSFPVEILGENDFITPNQYEAEVLSGVRIRTLDDAVKAVKVLDERCAARKVITLGEKGALASDQKNRFLHLFPRQIDVQDTTAAGDAFNAGLAFGLSTGMDWISTLQLANNAGAIACTRVGAQSALPYMRDIKNFSSTHGEGEFRYVDL
ncbi:MAG: ribokinase [Candidatus Atribacteria bacterium]|nr:ribokinase [Candidatus Atribacteria bacterium]